MKNRNFAELELKGLGRFDSEFGLVTPRFPEGFKRVFGKLEDFPEATPNDLYPLFNLGPLSKTNLLRIGNGAPVLGKLDQ